MKTEIPLRSVAVFNRTMSDGFTFNQVYVIDERGRLWWRDRGQRWLLASGPEEEADEEAPKQPQS